jgi:cytidine deaminase
MDPTEGSTINRRWQGRVFHAGSVQIRSVQQGSGEGQLNALGCLGSRSSLRAFAPCSRCRAYIAGVRRDVSPVRSTRNTDRNAGPNPSVPILI